VTSLVSYPQQTWGNRDCQS